MREKHMARTMKIIQISDRSFFFLGNLPSSSSGHPNQPDPPVSEKAVSPRLDISCFQAPPLQRRGPSSIKGSVSTSGYILFAKSTRSHITAANPDANFGKVSHRFIFFLTKITC